MPNKMSWGDDNSPEAVGICHMCKHKYSVSPGCAAYPSDIPMDILLGRIDHRDPVNGDNGIQFEPIEE